jgi:hypothetical protein
MKTQTQNTTPAKKETEGYKSDVLGQGSVSLKDLAIGPMSPREFSTGSVGLNHSGKVGLKCGPERYQFQVSLNITLAHSKPGDPKRVSQEDIDAFLALPPQSLKDLGLENAIADARTFSSGKVGFYANTKAVVGGNICQVGCSITAIGSDGDKWVDERPAEKSAEAR